MVLVVLFFGYRCICMQQFWKDIQKSVDGYYFWEMGVGPGMGARLTLCGMPFVYHIFISLMKAL